MHALRISLIATTLLIGCKPGTEQGTTDPGSHDHAAPATTPEPAPPAAVLAAPAPTAVAAPTPVSRPAPSQTAPTLDASRGKEIGLVFESFLTPHQEPDEEQNTPASTPKIFRSTTPSLTRAEREAAGHRGHGVVRFTRDFSRAFVDVKLEGVDPRTINMFHIHCGKPGILGPILVDFSQATDVQNNLADGTFSVEITNEHIVKTAEAGHGLIGAFTAGCVIPSPSLGTGKPTKVSTVAGMAQIALEGELYFNLHTTGQTYFGDVRGQLHRAER